MILVPCKTDLVLAELVANVAEPGRTIMPRSRRTYTVVASNNRYQYRQLRKRVPNVAGSRVTVNTTTVVEPLGVRFCHTFGKKSGFGRSY